MILWVRNSGDSRAADLVENRKPSWIIYAHAAPADFWINPTKSQLSVLDLFSIQNHFDHFIPPDDVLTSVCMVLFVDIDVVGQDWLSDSSFYPLTSFGV